MGQTIITARFKNTDSNPQDQLSVVFASRDLLQVPPYGSIGVQRTDTGVNVVAPGTSLTHESTGVYIYIIDDPAPNLIYLYSIYFTKQDGSTEFYQKTVQGSTEEPSVQALSLSTPADADAYFTNKLNCDDWLNLSDINQKQQALNDATTIINRFAYVGYKTEHHQLNEWPRRGIFGVKFDVIPPKILNAQYEIAYALLINQVDVQQEIEGQRVTSRRYAGVATTYDPKETADYILWGIPSWLAWTLMLPYIDLNKSESIRLDRLT